MKTKALFLLCISLGIGLTQLSAQTLNKGAVIAIHVYTFTLNPDVTFNQFQEFMLNKYIPEANKNFPGSKTLMLSGDRGENKNKIAFLSYFESVQVRDKYYPAPDKSSPDLEAALAKMKTITDEMAKYVVDYTDVYTDWIVK